MEHEDQIAVEDKPVASLSLLEFQDSRVDATQRPREQWGPACTERDPKQGFRLSGASLRQSWEESGE